MKTPEIDILNEFGKHMLGMGYEVYTEVVVPEIGTADMVIQHGRAWFCCEAKVEATYRLAVQARRWQFLCSQPIIVMPFKNLDEAYDLAVGHYKTLGIAVASPNGIFTGLKTPMTELSGISRFIRESQRFAPDQKFSKAGASSGKRASAINEAHQAIIDYVKSNSGCSLASAAKAGELKAMKLSKLIRSGQIKLVERTEMGKTYLEVPQ